MKSRLCLSLLIFFVAYALTTSKASPGAEEEGKEVKRVTGKVVVKDIKKSVLLLETADKKLNLTATTTNAKRGLEKVDVGDKVTVTYTKTGAKLTVISIMVEARPGGCPEGRPCPEDGKMPQR
jgi:S1-C subfamily serine protease